VAGHSWRTRGPSPRRSPLFDEVAQRRGIEQMFTMQWLDRAL
jgi:hypothetical protein